MTFQLIWSNCSFTQIVIDTIYGYVLYPHIVPNNNTIYVYVCCSLHCNCFLINLVVPRAFWKNNVFLENFKGELRVVEMGALLHNVTIPFASHMDVLYIVEFSFKYDGSQ